MSFFNADLHIHTCLSPCGDEDMSPRNIIRIAKERDMQIIAITDHNTTRNVRVCMELGMRKGVFVIPGCEVNTVEEVHCLCYFPDLQVLDKFQQFLDSRIADLINDPEKFGYQVAVDESDVIIYEEERSLFTGIMDGIDALAEEVHKLGGIFVPAHIDRPVNSLLSQLGFIPPDLKYDALEVSKRTLLSDFEKMHPELAGEFFLRNSDAHYTDDIAKAYNRFEMEDANWECFKLLFSK
ncbi:MAG: PHP domain-containing protein [Fermentimonas sp.]|nr:PHP domain-containing protein [Fermentimonas sp.]